MIRLRPDQLTRLNDLAQQLTEVFLDEADPATWPSMDSRDGRGDRLWLKKNAAKTLAIVTQLVFVGQRMQDTADKPADVEANIEDLIARAEKRASAFLEAQVGGGKKAPH